MTQRPAVLIMQRHLAPLSGFLESAYDVYRFWEGPPVEAAHDIRVMVVAGEYPLDGGNDNRPVHLRCFGDQIGQGVLVAEARRRITVGQ